jgi:hypothetical protein
MNPRIAAIMMWTLFCACVWLVWIASTVRVVESHGGTDSELGGAALIISGCTAGGWFCGMIAFVLVLAILRMR